MSIELISKRALAALLCAGLLLVQPLGQSLVWAEDEVQGESEAAVDDDAEDVATEDEEEETDIGAPLGLTVLGVATLAGGVGYFIASGDDESLAAQYAADDPSYQQQLLDRSDREKIVAITLTSLSVALLGTATYLWITLGDDDEVEGDDVEVTFAPTFSLEGGGFQLSGTF